MCPTVALFWCGDSERVEYQAVIFRRGSLLVFLQCSARNQQQVNVHLTLVNHHCLVKMDCLAAEHDQLQFGCGTPKSQKNM